jgi:NADPH:quinone reductase-like Zn-dependent oxidoreductase
VKASAASPGQTGKDEEMKAFAVDDLGGLGSLHELSVPEPAEGQLRLRVAASGLNPFDVAVVQGYMKDRMEHRFPLVPGMDASGTVDALGEGVSDWTVGEDSFGSVGKPYLGEGTLAEFVTVSTGTVARKPSSLDHTVAAAIPTAGVTAMIMADALQLSGGQTVVAIGATGGVGSYFVQLATRRGARVVAISRGENAEYARRLGAPEVVDYTAGDVVAAIRTGFPAGIDAVADMHGDREQLAGLAEQVRSGGHVASAVGAADVDGLKARGVEATNVVGRVTTAALEALAGMLAAGEILPPDIHPFPLAGAADALATLGTSHVRGKIVVTVAS